MLMRNREQQTNDAIAIGIVQCRRWLVGEQDRRPVYHGPRDRYALCLPLAEMTDLGMLLIRQPKFRQHLIYTTLIGPHAGEIRSHQQIFLDGQCIDQMIPLKNKPDVSSAKTVGLSVGQNR